MRKCRLNFWLWGLILLLLAADPAHGTPVFKSEAQVAGEYITLGHLADLDPELQQKCGAALIWSAPPPGQLYTLTQEFLKFRLAQMGLAGFFEGVPLPPAIQVRQTGVLLSGEEVAKTFRRYVQEHNPYPAANLLIEVFPLEEAVILPDAQVTLEALPPRSGKLVGDVNLEMVVLHGGQTLKRIKVSGKVRVERQVVCATRPLKSQEIIGPGDVQVLRRDVTGLNAGEFFISPDQVIGRTLCRNVGPQEIITSRHLSHQPVIKRGDEVTVVLEQDGLEISTKGVAQEQGHPGKTIRLLNPKSKKEFQGSVIDAKTVRVKL
jgi:flagella basal body P-ring formation protein FlgA|uniref:Flagellar basal body P-ring formation protein FlgA n=1 Tax=Desulfobacca acetoxidans TaxID=60893 RepID=A0A7C5ENR7_9BACT